MSESRRTREQIKAIRSKIRALLERNNPQTVRQVFYRLVSLGAIGKTSSVQGNSRKTADRDAAEQGDPLLVGSGQHALDEKA